MEDLGFIMGRFPGHSDCLKRRTSAPQFVERGGDLRTSNLTGTPDAIVKSDGAIDGLQCIREPPGKPSSCSVLGLDLAQQNGLAALRLNFFYKIISKR